MKIRYLLIWLMAGLLMAGGCGLFKDKENTEEVSAAAESRTEYSTDNAAAVSTAPDAATATAQAVSELTDAPETTPGETVIYTSDEYGYHPEAGPLDYLNGLEIPEYSGRAYVVINDNVPFFEKPARDETKAYETYYDLDGLGRCTLADACVGTEIMPTEKRGEISQVRPTGWRVSLYDKNLVDGESLYNRCHLIAYTLTAENANKYNLVTGTRYFNTAGMNSFENMVADYIRETNKHVRYRVTPVWTGDNLICDGVLMEGWSVEDGGEDICYCIFAYNVQPGIEIDYATGDNWLVGGERPEYVPTLPPTEEVDTIGDYVLNIKTKRFHRPDCEGAISMNEQNRQEYHGSRNQLLLDGYKPCGGCQP